MIAWYITSLGILHLVVAMGLYQMVSQHLHQEIDRRLDTYTECVVELLPRHRGVQVAQVIGEMTELSRFGPDLYVRVVDKDGQVVYHASSLPPETDAILEQAAQFNRHEPWTIELVGFGVWRTLTHRVETDGASYVGQVAIPLKSVHTTLRRLQMVLLLVVPLVMVLTSIGAWLLLNHTLAPLRQMIHSVQALQAKEFDQPLRVPRTGDEVEALASAYNAMILRMQRSFTQMRQFVSDASHELRTPLAVLKGEVELGVKGLRCVSPCQDILVRCAAETSRLSRLVDKLLFLSSADAQRITLDRKPVRLAPLLSEMAEQARFLAEAKDIQVELRNGIDLELQGDEMRLRQLLLNLIDNAVKYTPERGRITLESHVADQGVELVVSDTGVGIGAEDLPRIFDRFYRADKSRARDGNDGFGLGLAICKWIAEAHHGTISVESIPGKGSTFRVRLALA